MRRLIISLLSAIFLVMASSLAKAEVAQPDSGITVVITGKVSDRVSRRALAADMTYTQLGEVESAPQSVVIDPATGEYRVELQAGFEYRITARVTGFSPMAKRVNLTEATPEMKLIVNFELERDPSMRRVEPADPFGTLVTVVYFDGNSVGLTDASKAELDRLLKVLQANPDVRLWVHGHADVDASYEVNHRLSELRAQAVRAYLIAHDIAPFRLPSISYSNTRMMTSFKEDRHLNDRVEFHLSSQ